tara:strand:+ start:606 stop:1037 length:432 start_codon:yes stop_codon:yes gene_type:complete
MDTINIFKTIGRKKGISYYRFMYTYQRFKKIQIRIGRFCIEHKPVLIDENDIVVFSYLVNFIEKEDINDTLLYSLWWVITAHCTEDNPYGTWLMSQGLKIDKYSFDNMCIKLTCMLSKELHSIITNDTLFHKIKNEYKDIKVL